MLQLQRISLFAAAKGYAAGLPLPPSPDAGDFARMPSAPAVSIRGGCACAPRAPRRAALVERIFFFSVQRNDRNMGLKRRTPDLGSSCND